MNNEVVKVTQTEMLEMAKMFVESKMFDGMSAVAMAFVKIQAGKEIGISPFASMSGISIIKGKASIGAGLMAGCVKGSGKYDYKVLKLDETICSIDFLQGGKVIGNSQFSIADAKKAGTQNLDKFPRNMLFARAMSNGTKWFCPDVFTMPVYTPEEMGELFVDDIPHELVDTPTGETQPTNGADPVTPSRNAAAILKGKKAEELESAIQALDMAETVQDLKDHKALLPAYVVSDASFVDAATKRYNLIIAQPANVPYGIAKGTSELI